MASFVSVTCWCHRCDYGRVLNQFFRDHHYEIWQAVVDLSKPQYRGIAPPINKLPPSWQVELEDDPLWQRDRPIERGEIAARYAGMRERLDRLIEKWGRK